MKTGTTQLIAVVVALLAGVLLYTLPKQSSTKLEEAAANPLEERTDLQRAIDLVNGEVNPMEGIQILLRLVEEDSTNVEAHLWLGRFSIKSGQLDKAFHRFETIVRIDPNHLDGNWELAMLSWEMQNWEVAQLRFEKTYELDSSYYNALFFNGQCLETLGRPEEALVAYETLLPKSDDETVVNWLVEKIAELKD